MGFLIQAENEKQKFKVFIGERHTCSCKLFAKKNDLCKHICWILLRKFRLDKHDPLSWQSGLCEREISIILERQDTETSKKAHTYLRTGLESSFDSQIRQRDIEANDICPICQDEFLRRQRFPVTYCRKGCGNNVHIKCMKMWKDHQIQERNLNRSDSVSCPMCRGEFSKLEDLLLEIKLCENYFAKTSKDAWNTDWSSERIIRDFELFEEHNAVCADCQCSPIVGRLYCAGDDEIFSITDKTNVLLCSKCFEQRTRACVAEKSRFYWREFDLGSAAACGCVLIYCKTEVICCLRSLSASEVLKKPLCRKELCQIAKWVVKVARISLPKRRALRGTKEFGAARGLLTPGRQCRICLMHFREGDEVRKLCGCNHVFHTRCVDQWLLHMSVFTLIH
ncbi:unnamed protein product [Hydatigera taeniaeformis]|uniref:E3 ubiquitin-protein ligase ZSWIM2 n=1 Tax=Hydatigena taeniaeformis TaxID=6205 RepID=A0A0R3X2K2_HYDTA|nr:unnamed protein product [Hydatigera taeniaeformis]